MQALSILLWSSSTWPFFIILVLIQCTDSYQKCIHRQYVFSFFFFLSPFFIFYFFLSAKLGGLQACRLTPPHLMRLLVIVWSNKRLYPLQTLHCFKEMCYWTALHAGHVWFFFLCLKMSYFVGWLQHGTHTSFRPPHFFGTETKKWQDFPPPVVVHFSCVEVHHHRLS